MASITTLFPASFHAIAKNTSTVKFSSSPIIGTALTATVGVWTRYPILTYQWQINNGTWTDINGATTTSYTPQLGDFGYTLRILEIPNGDRRRAVSSLETTYIAQQPAQIFSSELVQNGDFSDGSGTFPNHWTPTITASPPDYYVENVNPDGTAGNGACHYVADTPTYALKQNIISQNSWYEVAGELTHYTSGSVILSQSGFGWLILSAQNKYSTFIKATGASNVFQLARNTNCDVVIDSISLKNITLNTQVSAPLANMVIKQFYTLPDTPRFGDSIYLYARISDFLAQSYWFAKLIYNSNSTWSIQLFSSNAGSISSAFINTTNIGTTNGIRFTMSGDNLTLETTSDNGSTWTQRGTASSSLFDTSTGVNITAASDITLGLLEYNTPYSNDDFGELQQLIDQNSVVTLDSGRTYTLSRTQALKMHSNLRITSDGTAIIHKDGVTDSDYNTFTGADTLVGGGFTNIEIDHITFSGNHVSGWTNAQMACIDLTNLSTGSSTKIHDCVFQNLVGFSISGLSHSDGLLIYNNSYTNCGNGVNTSWNNTEIYNETVTTSEGYECLGNNLFIHDITLSHVFSSALSIGGDVGGTMYTGIVCQDITVTSQDVGNVGVITADGLTSAIMRRITVSGSIVGFSSQVSTGYTSVTHGVLWDTCTATSCETGFYFPNEGTRLDGIEVTNATARSITAYGIQVSNPNTNIHNSDFRSGASKDVLLQPASNGMTFDSGTVLYNTILDQR